MNDPYIYPGTEILKNKFGIRDAGQLEYAEIKFVTQRIRAGVPQGNFDLRHLQAIHQHQFQDVYEWAGKIRTVEINKNGSQFQFMRYIETGMADVHKRLVQTNYLRGLSPSEFSRQAGEIMGDVNYVHPFREGNGRTQLQYLKQLAGQAGHSLDLSRLTPAQWIMASKEAHVGKYDIMGQAIKGCIIKRESQIQRDDQRER